jgi:electron transfer flavoprotein alpha subunit
MSEIWVWVEQQNGAAANVSWEAVGLAHALAEESGNEVVALAFGGGAAEAAQGAIWRGADRAIICEGASLDGCRVDPCATLLSNLAKERQPAVILAGTTTRGSDVIGAAAVDLEAGMISDVVGLALVDGVVETEVPVYSGKLLAEVLIPEGTPQLITIRNRAFPMPDEDASRSGPVETVEPVLAESDIPTKIIGFEAQEGEVNLSDASIVVAGGRGVGGPEGFGLLRDLADVLGGALGASRAVVDAGWVPYEFQVGQTGKNVSPDLYIACGISGAVQHQAGMRTSKVIVAINSDPDAPIFKLAHYGIVGDLFEIVPELTKAFKARLG